MIGGLVATALLGAQTRVPFPGLINARDGLRGWFESRQEIANPGTDVVFLGDSYFGQGAQSRFQQSMVNLLKVQLQNSLNPPNCPGGYGFIATSEGGSNNTVTTGTLDPNGPLTMTGPLDANDDYGNWSTLHGGYGTGLRHVGLGAASSKALIFRMNGSLVDAAGRRYFVSSFQVVYRRSEGAGRLYCDVGNGTTVARGAGSPSYVVSTAGHTEYGARSGYVHLADPTAANRIHIRGDGTYGEKIAFIDGIIAYDGDEHAGVRVHDVSNSGTRWSFWNEASRQASIDKWGTKTAGSNAKLFVLSSMVNECNIYLGIDVYIASLLQITRRIQALPSQPSVIVLIPFKPAAWSSNIEGSLFSAYRDQIETLAIKEHFAVLDAEKLAEDLNVDPHSTGWIASDGKHFNPRGHEIIASTLGSVLSQ